jgi:hypothetical protein
MVTDLNGNTIIPDSSLWSMFSGLDNTPAGFDPTLDNSLLDARAAYDSSTGRYVVIGDNFQPGGGNFGTNIVIAVSVDSNPADGWRLASIDTSNGFTTQSDMPYLSVSNGNISITTPEYLDAGGGYNTAEFIVSESSVIAAGNAAIAPNASNIASGSNGIMRNVAGANGKTYYLSAYSNHTRTILAFQTYDATTGSFSAPKTLGLDDSDVGGGGSDYTAAQLGTTKLLNVNDSRIQGLAYASSGGHDYVYGVSEVMPSAGATPEIEWFKLDVTDPANPQIVMGDVISGASIGAGVAVFNPSIAIDQNGDVLINFSASGPNMYPADYYTVLGAGLSAFSAPTLYQASDTFFDSGSPSGSTNMRWGTYSTAVAAPNNPNGFWISNEYISTTVKGGAGGAYNWWDTVVAQVQVGALVANPVLAGAGNSVVYFSGGAPIAVDPGLTVSDASSATLDSATVAITAGLLAGDTLGFTAQSGISGSYNAATGVLTFTGHASLAAYQAALDSVAYSSTNADATNAGADATRTITWTATSAGTTSTPVASTINVAAPPASAVVATLFSGLSDPTNSPPHNALAVGPGNIFMAETTHYEITDLTGGAATTGSLYTLFSSLGSTLDNALLDPRAAYDSSTGRFVVIADNLQPGGGSFRTNVDIAVSRDSNPADGWYFASIDTSINGTAQSDMPYLSVGGGNIYITAPENLDAGGFGGTGQWVLSESSVVTGSVAPASYLSAPANFITRNVAGANGVTYYLSAHSTGSKTNLSYQSYNPATGFSSVQTIALNNSDVGPGSGVFTAQQAGTSLTLDVGDSRIESLAYANGYVWGVSEVKPSASSPPAIHWFKLNVSNAASPSVVAEGDLTGATIGSGVGVFDASIAVDGNGDVLINFTASGPNMTPADYYALSAPGASSFSAPTQYQSSTSYFQETANATGAQRWGTYSSAIADPNNANGFWISNEYVTNTGVTIPTGLPAWWSTVTAQVTVSSSSPPSLGGAGVAAAYTEGGAAATLDSLLTVSDPSSSTLSGATVTIASGLFAGDTLNFANQSTITGSYNSAAGTLTLTGSASLAAYQTALDSVSFSSSSLNPTNYGADLTRAINWQVSAGALQSAVVSSSVNVVGVDQAPVLSGAGNTTTYASGGVAVVIDGSLAVSDPDNLNLASATVTITGNFQSGDQINFTPQNGISGSYNSGVLTLTGSATVAQYQAALDSLTFSTNSVSAASRIVSWQVSDGTKSSAIAASTVAIAAQAPTLGGVNSIAQWVQAVPPATTSTPVAVDPTLTVADASSPTLSSARIAITTGFRSGDQLVFVNQPSISGSYNASTGVLTLSGAANLAAYQAALDSITFTSTNSNPTSTGSDSARTITWTVTAGTLTSASLTSTIDLGQTYKLSTSKDTISAGVGNDTIVAPTPSTINSTDSLNGGGGSNTLLLQGAGTFNLGTPKTLNNIQNVNAPGVAGGTTSVTLRNGLNNLAIEVGSGVLNETFNVNAAGSTSDTFLLTPDFGALTISGFAATGSGHDILQFQASMFSYLTPSTMTQAQEAMAVLSHATQSGANTVIADSLGDKVTLNSVSISTLNANLGDFKFV